MDPVGSGPSILCRGRKCYRFVPLPLRLHIRREAGSLVEQQFMEIKTEDAGSAPRLRVFRFEVTSQREGLSIGQDASEDVRAVRGGIAPEGDRK